MSTDFGKRLKAARKHARLSQEDLARLIGIPQSSIGYAEASAHSSRMTTQIATACGVDPLWLATGEGDMLSSTAFEVRESKSSAYDQAVARVAPASHHSDRERLVIAGLRPLAVDQPLVLAWEDLQMTELPPLFVVHLSDDSMRPEFPMGSGVLFDSTIKEYRAGDAVLVKDADGGVAFRIFVPRTRSEWTAAAVNAQYASMDSARDGLKIIAVKVGAWGRRG